MKSAQQALKNAGMNKAVNITNAAKVQPLLNYAKGLKYVTRGVALLDIWIPY